MWVRNKNRQMLIKVDCFVVSGRTILGFQGPDDGEGVPLGEYESYERALEVLDLLQDDCMRGHKIGTMPRG